MKHCLFKNTHQTSMNLARHFSSHLKNGQVGVTSSVCSATDGVSYRWYFTDGKIHPLAITGPVSPTDGRRPGEARRPGVTLR